MATPRVHVDVPPPPDRCCQCRRRLARLEDDVAEARAERRHLWLVVAGLSASVAALALSAL